MSVSTVVVDRCHVGLQVQLVVYLAVPFPESALLRGATGCHWLIFFLLMATTTVAILFPVNSGMKSQSVLGWVRSARRSQFGASSLAPRLPCPPPPNNNKHTHTSAVYTTHIHTHHPAHLSHLLRTFVRKRLLCSS